jgi:hypothetical protein
VWGPSNRAGDFLQTGKYRFVSEKLNHWSHFCLQGGAVVGPTPPICIRLTTQPATARQSGSIDYSSVCGNCACYPTLPDLECPFSVLPLCPRGTALSPTLRIPMVCSEQGHSALGVVYVQIGTYDRASEPLSLSLREPALTLAIFQLAILRGQILSHERISWASAPGLPPPGWGAEGDSKGTGNRAGKSPQLYIQSCTCVSCE